MTLGIPNLLSMSTSSHSARSSGVLCGSFLIWTHFEKQSTATAKTEFPSESVGKDGIRSMAQIWNGYCPFSVGYSSPLGYVLYFFCFLQGIHLVRQEAMVLSISGHQYYLDRISRNLSLPQCPNYSWDVETKSSRLAGEGTTTHFLFRLLSSSSPRS